MDPCIHLRVAQHGGSPLSIDDWKLNTIDCEIGNSRKEWKSDRTRKRKWNTLVWKASLNYSKMAMVCQMSCWLTAWRGLYVWVWLLWQSVPLKTSFDVYLTMYLSGGYLYLQMLLKVREWEIVCVCVCMCGIFLNWCHVSTFHFLNHAFTFNSLHLTFYLHSKYLGLHGWNAISHIQSMLFRNRICNPVSLATTSVGTCVV